MYKKNYLKYKLKYLNLKKELNLKKYGGSNKKDKEIDLNDINAVDLENKEINLNDINAVDLEKLIERQEKFLLYVYAPWCTYCNNFMDDYKLLLNNIKNLYRIDGTIYMEEINEKNLLKNNIVKGYPSFFKFEENKITEFKEDRSVELLKNFYIN
jgi:hypothetical protein